MQKIILKLILLGLSLVISSACVRTGSYSGIPDIFSEKIPTSDELSQVNTTGEGASLESDSLNVYFPVDAIFQSFYSFLGGREILGPAISPLEELGDVKRQYVEAGMMVFNPNAIGSERYQLSPLGLDFGVATPGMHSASDGEARIIDGHVIFSKFIPMYDKLGGARFVGRPITEARYDPENGRFLQYFENLGFYILDSDKTESIRLLAYGASSCDQTCRYKSPPESIIIRKPLLTEPFASMVDSMGLPFVGRTLTDPTYAYDGKSEIIFENLVLVEDGANPHGVLVKSIVKMLGFQAKPLEANQNDPLMVFYPIDGDKGYNVPVYFDSYLRSHGGLEVSGLPISGVYQLRTGGFRQCFENLCLDFEPDSPEDTRLKPASLGVAYKKAFFSRGGISLSLDNIQIYVWERNPVVISSDPQEIFVAILEHNKPLKNREPILTLILPDGAQETYRFPPTNDRGQTSLKVPSVSAPNGTLIAYQVCLPGAGEESQCVGDNYMIWKIP